MQMNKFKALVIGLMLTPIVIATGVILMWLSYIAIPIIIAMTMAYVIYIDTQEG
jgi:hypothetical protein